MAAFVFVSIGTLRMPLRLPDTTILQRNTGSRPVNVCVVKA